MQDVDCAVRLVGKGSALHSIVAGVLAWGCCQELLFRWCADGTAQQQVMICSKQGILITAATVPGGSRGLYFLRAQQGVAVPKGFCAKWRRCD